MEIPHSQFTQRQFLTMELPSNLAVTGRVQHQLLHTPVASSQSEQGTLRIVNPVRDLPENHLVVQTEKGRHGTAKANLALECDQVPVDCLLQGDGQQEELQGECVKCVCVCVRQTTA